MPGWLKFLLIIIVLPILVGAIVLFVAGRPVAFEILQRRIAARFPEVKWISTQDLGRWQDDSGQPQPLILDARTQPEFAVSHLRGAVLIDPYRPSLRPLRGGPSFGGHRGLFVCRIPWRPGSELAQAGRLHQCGQPVGRVVQVGQRGKTDASGRESAHAVGAPL